MRNGNKARKRELGLSLNLVLSGRYFCIHDGSGRIGLADDDLDLNSGLEADGCSSVIFGCRLIRAPAVNKMTIAGFDVSA
jgi:hypothetical protein